MHAIAGRWTVPLSAAALALCAYPIVSLAAITAGPTVTVTPHQVTIAWTTDTSRSTEVHWGPASAPDETGYPNHSGYSLPAGTRHSRTLNHVPPGTYYFRVRSTDGVSPDVSAEASFVVANGGSTPVGTLIPDGPVNAMARSGNVLYFGGNFTSLSTRRGQGVAVDPATGIAPADQPMVAGGEVVAIVSDGAGGSFIGGRFQYVGGLPRPYLAHLLPDGGIDPSFAPTLDGEVNALALSGGILYLGGTFTHVNGATRNLAAALDATTGVETAWNPDAGGGGAVYALAVSGTTVYLGGSFLAAGGASRTNAAAVDATTGSVLSWDPQPNDTVFALAASGTTVYLGGYLTSVNGTVSRSRAAAVDASSGAALPWDPAPDSQVYAIAVSGGRVYLGGTFRTLQAGTVARNRAAAVDPATGAPLAWDPNLNGSVQALVVSGSTVSLGGLFTTVGSGGTPRRHVAAVDTASATPTPWNPSANDQVLALEASSSRVLIGGYLTSVNVGTTRNNAAAMDLSTGALTAWNPDLGGEVKAMKLSGSTVYLGGAFTTANGGTTRNHAAAVDASSGTLLPWNPNLDDRVDSLEVAGSIVYLGGRFGQVGGTTRLRLAAVDATTAALVSTFNPAVGVLGDTVATMAFSTAAFSTNRLYFGGDFRVVNGTTRNRAAMVDADSGVLENWNPNVDSSRPSARVNAIAVSGNVVYLGGSFTITSAGVTPNVTAMDLYLGIGVWFPADPSNEVYSVAPSDGRVFLGGAFNSMRGAPVSTAAVVAASYALLLDWQPQVSGDGPRAILANCAAGQLALGGAFRGYGSVPQRGLAAIEGFTCPPINHDPVAGDQDVSTPEDTPLPITLTASDPDGNPLTFRVVQFPSHGVLSGTAPNLTYTPDPNFHGTDALQFDVSDGSSGYTSAYVDITVSSVNDPPQASDFDVFVNEDVPTRIGAYGTDVDYDTLTYVIVQPPTHGTLVGNPWYALYTPDPEFSGADQLTFTATDGMSPPVSATIFITINPVNDAPAIAVPPNSTSRAGVPIAFTVSASDVEGDPVTLSAVVLPPRGTFDTATGAFSWTPAAGELGLYRAIFRATDGSATRSKTVLFTIVANQVPALTVPAAQVVEVSHPLQLTVSATDPDGDPVTLSATGLPDGANFDPALGAFSWTPDADQAGDYEVTFSATDGTDSATATVAVSVSPTPSCGCRAGPGSAAPGAFALLALALAARCRDRTRPRSHRRSLHVSSRSRSSG